jgi:inorganic pyrophosphatase
MEMFRFEKVLPLGQTFPFDFGFLPSTIGGEGDPLDVLLLSEAPVPTGSLVLGKILAVMEGEQVEKGKKQRNDRIIAVPLDAKCREPLQPAIHFDEGLAKSLTEFLSPTTHYRERNFDP